VGPGRGGGGGGGGPGPAGGGRPGRAGGRGARAPGAAAGGGAGGALQVFGGCALEQESGRARAEGAGQDLLVVERGQYEYGRRVLEASQRASGGHAVHARHPDVHHDDIRTEPGHNVDDVCAGIELTYDGEPIAFTQYAAQAGADEFLVVDDEDTDERVVHVGITASTSQSSCSGPAVRWPPSARARSHIAEIPFPVRRGTGP
jgi:hypothetical protein